MSDELLRLDQAAFGAIDAVLLEKGSQAVGEVDKSVRRVGGPQDERHKRMAHDQRLISALVGLQEEAAIRVIALIAGLAGDAGRTALDSMGDELGLVEKTQSTRMRGVAEEAVEDVAGRMSATIQEITDEYERRVTSQLGNWETDLRLALGAAESMADLRDRLFRVKNPIGAWFKPAGTYKTNARGLSVLTSNTVREMALEAFNRLATERA